MDAQQVDPRDITWEVDYPTYRVTFWRPDGSASDEWRLTERGQHPRRARMG